jgi:hypothetical protein
MKDALISKILEPLWIVYDDLNDSECPEDQMADRHAPRLRHAIDTVKKDLEIFIGNSLDPE